MQQRIQHQQVAKAKISCNNEHTHYRLTGGQSKLYSGLAIKINGAVSLFAFYFSN